LARPININLYLKVYKKLAKGNYHKKVAEDLKISETHVGRIANFLTKEYFLFLQLPKSNIIQYSKTKRIPTPKILFTLIKARKDKDGGSSLCEFQKLQYRCEIQSKINERVIRYCRLIKPKGVKKYLFPPYKNSKFGFNCIFHDGKYKKSLMIYPNRIYLTNDEIDYSDDIIDERIRNIAYGIQHFFKVKLGMPKAIGRNKEYAFVPKEKFLIDALEEAIFEIESPVGKVKADKSGDKKYLEGKQVEFDNKRLAKDYLNLIPEVEMIGRITLDNKVRIEQIESNILPSLQQNIETILKETSNIKNILNPETRLEDPHNPSYV